MKMISDRSVNNWGLLKSLIFLLLFLTGAIGFAQAPTKFYTRFGGYGDDVGYGVKQTLDGQYIVTGSTSSFGSGNTDVYLAKVDSMGWPIWQKAYGGFSNDIGRQVIQLADSGFVIAGYTNSQGAGGYDIYLVRTDKNGAFIWEKTFGGMDWDFAYDLKQTADNGYLICGSTMSFGRGLMDGYVIKTDANGVLQWSKLYGGAQDDEFRSIVLTYNNLYAFAGTTKSYGDVNGDCWLFKTDLNGDSVLHVSYGDAKKQFVNDFVEETNGDFIFAGATDINGRDTTWGYVLSLKQNGIFNYDNNYPRSEKYKDYQFTTITKGNAFNTYFYVYRTWEAPVGFKLEPLFMLFSGPYANTYTTYGSLGNEEIYDASKTRDKGYISVGYTDGFNANSTDIFLVKMDSNLVGAGSAIGIKEVKEVSMNATVFPTCTRDFLSIEVGKELSHVQLSLTDCLGHSLLKKTISESDRLNIEDRPAGIYFITLSDMNFSKTFKVIKTE